MTLALLAVVVVVACAPGRHARKIDVGGHRLSYRCLGQGSPAVVMDSGLGDTMQTWDDVAPSVALFTRACVYDRAGLGRSDPGPLPRSSRRIADELHALLERAGVPPPFVLVGHSLGGLNVRLFAGTYPEDVVGLVLVEATHEDFPERERRLRPEDEKRRIEHTLNHAAEAARSEYGSLTASVAEVRASPPVPDVPLIVISAAKRDDPPALRDAWQALQRDLVSLSPQGRRVLAEESGHYVPFDQPEIVVQAIRDVVEEARRRPARGTASP